MQTKSGEHSERHFRGGDAIRDIVLGMADGLTVPFALAAGISGAISASHVVVTAGAAEITAGSIAMGLGGYLAAKSQAEFYASEKRREEIEIIEKPEAEAAEVTEVLKQYGLSDDEAGTVVNSLRRRPEAWRDFMMRFELGLEEPNPGRALISGITIGLSYIVGGIIPLTPYIICSNVRTGLYWSTALTLTALLVFGYIRGKFTGVSCTKSAIQTLIVGGLAAAAAYGLAKMIT